MLTRFQTTRESLSRFGKSVEAEYRRRPPYDDYPGGLRQVNTIRIVACQVLESLPYDEQLAIIQDLYTLDSVELQRDNPHEIFAASDSIGSYLFDLACEVVWQMLVTNLEIRVEDEIRLALAEV
jgi:hypothetical protein